MKLVIGGAFQGKLDYAKKSWNLDEGWLDGEICTASEIPKASGIDSFHLYLRRLLIEKDYFGGDPTVLEDQAAACADALYRENPSLVIIADELSSGIVPAEKNERIYREFVGRTLTDLAALSDEVVRLTAGLPERLK